MLTILFIAGAIVFTFAVFCCGFALGMWHGQAEALNQIPKREVEKERQLAELRMKEQEHITAQAQARNDSMASAMRSVYESQAIASAAARSGGHGAN